MKTALIGAYKDDSNKGSAYIFKRNGSTDSTTKTYCLDGSSNDYFGNAVILYEDYALIGAYGDNGSNPGSAIFLNGMVLGLNNKNLLFQMVRMMIILNIVSLYGDYALIGAYGDDDTDLLLDQLIF